jgi:uncharacterized membrane protein YgcG
MTEVALRLERYAMDSDLNRSDQITVPVRIWRNLYHEHDGGERPLFVGVQGGAEQLQRLVARIRPAGTGELEDEHSCLIPDWMWVHLGAPEYGTWLTLAVTTVANVGTLVLRPRAAGVLAALDDPVAALTAALTGTGGEASWAVLCVGAELPLWCGVFDVVGMRTLGGSEMVVGCILDHDVTLELEAAVTATAVTTPPPSPPAVLLPDGTGDGGGSGGGMSFPGMGGSSSGGASGFQPFSGAGRTLGGR